jgi:hypothetical protein
MPTILVLLGWRLFFYANERNEPIHVHCRKGDVECKYWIRTMAGISKEALDMGRHHKIEKVTIEKGIISLSIDGSSLQINLEDVSDVLANAKEEEQQEFEVSPSGYGIHWPLIDEDISIDGLLGIEHKPNSNRKSAAGASCLATVFCLTFVISASMV